MLGYSGWAKGQLEKEISENGWLDYSCNRSKLIFATEPELKYEAALKTVWGIEEACSFYTCRAGLKTELAE